MEQLRAVGGVEPQHGRGRRFDLDDEHLNAGEAAGITRRDRDVGAPDPRGQDAELAPPLKGLDARDEGSPATAAYSRGSPSASVKYGPTLRAAAPPTRRFTAGISPDGSGARLPRPVVASAPTHELQSG